MTRPSRNTARPADESAARGKTRVTVLEATLEVRWPATPPVEGWLSAAVARMMPGDAGQRVRLLLGPSQQRLDFESAGVTIVHAESTGSQFWDRATKSFARLPPELRPRTAVRASRHIRIDERTPARPAATGAGKRRQTASGGVDIGSTVRIDVDDETLGASSIEIDFSADAGLAPFGPGLLRALYCGPACHRDSGLPWDELARRGLPVAARIHDAQGRLVGGWSVVEPKPVSRPASDFAPPAGYRSLADLLRKPPRQPPPRPVDPAPPVAPTVPPFEPAGAGARRQALDGVPTRNRIRDVTTPDCLGSTRLGTMSATLHQDLFTAVQSVVNMVVPLVGNTVIAGGAWSIPWMANMAATVGAAPTARGAGLFTLLRNPRVVNGGVMSGGDGLIDSLAWARLSERDSAGLTRTEREFAAGTLPATLARWGVGAPLDAALLAASGRIDALTLDERVMLVEACEIAEIGTFTVTLPAAALAPIPVGSTIIAGLSTPPLFTVTLASLTGGANFATLPGGVLVSSAVIGGAGNVVLGLNLPDISLTATLLRVPTAFGGLVLGLGTVAVCLLFPLLCPLFTVLATLAAFVLTNLSTVRATTTAVGLSLDIGFRFDAGSERVEPFVSVASRSGVTAVATTSLVPNPIAALVDTLAAAIGNAVDAWGALLADQLAQALQTQLRQQGLHFPVAGRQNELRAVDGLATSSAGGLLELQVELAPPQGIALTPWATQVPRPASVTDRLVALHLSMRRELNPQPPAPPGPGPVLTVGSFAGLALSQNAINQYLFSQWLQRRFEVTVTDPRLVAAFWRSSPHLFARAPQRVHLWPATPPRAELAAGGLARGAAPLVVFFDDVRVCFETSAGVVEAGNPPSGSWELAFNFSAPAQVDLAWPFVFSLALDPAPAPPLNLEPGTWEFVDHNDARVMARVTTADLEKMATLAAQLLVGPHARTVAPPVGTVPAWTAPLVSARQALLPIPASPSPLRDQAIYLELLAHRKTAYLLPGVWVTLLELIDGSGAPSLQFLLGLAGAPQPITGSVLGMTAAQGAALRAYLAPRLRLPLGP